MSEGAVVPVNIVIGLFALLGALTLYTIGAWTAFRTRRFSAGLIVVLWVGVAFDVLATVMMGMQIGGLDLRPGAPLVHTILALLALGGMILGTAVATWASAAGRGAIQARVSRILLAPWVLWVAVFIWGMVTRGAARLSG